MERFAILIDQKNVYILPKTIYRFYTTHQNPKVKPPYSQRSTKDLDSQSTAEQKHSAGANSIICCKFYHRAMAEQGTSTKQTRRSVEYQSQAKCKHMQAPDFGKHVKKYTLKQPLQQTVMIIKLHSHTQKNETGSLSLPCIKINCTGSKI